MDMIADRPAEAPPASSRLGTRFLLFPQPPFIPGYERPEIVRISTPPEEIGAGPADRRMYVVDPLLPKRPYQYPYLPPFDGLAHPPVLPGPDGHFDHLQPGTREFRDAHVFACISRMLDICGSYLGREIPWFFGSTYARLEVVSQLAWDNAQSGYGFLEMGEDNGRGEPYPYALSFDAVAHETGHLILFGIMGLPDARVRPTHDLLAYHEAVADFLSLIGLLHFDTALDLLLRRTRGNLLIMNELDRFAETSDEKQVRTFSHSLKLHDVGPEVHDRSKPFAGALFDTLIEIYQILLYERGLSDIDPRGTSSLRQVLSQADVEQRLRTPLDEYETRHFAVKSVLAEARDIMGEILIQSLVLLDAERVSFGGAAEALIHAAASGRSRRFAGTAYVNFVWRAVI